MTEALSEERASVIDVRRQGQESADLGDMKQMLPVPYELEQEEDGTWGAHASFPSGGAHGIGDTPEDAVADLNEAVSLVIEEFGGSRRTAATL